MKTVRFNSSGYSVDSEVDHIIADFKNNRMILYFSDDIMAREAERVCKQVGCKTSHDDSVITIYNTDQLNNIEII